ncbi:MAG: hypothetical protein KDB27_21090 [Planctomycetales bacterium]|nr:hypothetical protein [Planctomycetales bacterium]
MLMRSKTAASELQESLFVHVTHICHTRNLTMLRLDAEFAVFRASTTHFVCEPEEIVAFTAFRFDRHVPWQIGTLLENQNSLLEDMSWHRDHELHLSCPIVATDLSRDILNRTIGDMLAEIDRFGRRLRANGMWES